MENLTELLFRKRWQMLLIGLSSHFPFLLLSNRTSCFKFLRMFGQMHLNDYISQPLR